MSVNDDGALIVMTGPDPGGARTGAAPGRTWIVAILETARGGLLRRGLGVERADAALITNISEDHLGDFGSRDLDDAAGGEVDR